MDQNTITILSIVSIFAASALSSLVAWKIAMYVNSKKVPVEVKQIKADTDLTGGELAEKYQQIANTQADKNIALSQTNTELNNKIDAQQKDIDNLKQYRIEDRDEFRKAIEEEKQRSLAAEQRAIRAEAYIKRLILQLQSWNITPVPYDVEEVKEKIKQACIEGEPNIGV